MRGVRNWLRVVVGTVGLWSVSGSAFSADDYLALVRPWVADELKLSNDQRTQAKVRVRDLQTAMIHVAGKYPLGGQDVDGTRQRERLEKQLQETFARTSLEVRNLLTDEQLECFQKMTLAPPLSEKVKFETRRSFSALLWPFEFSKLKLTADQNSRVSAILLQAKDDWCRGSDDPDQRLQAQRERVARQLREVLTDKQRQLLPTAEWARAPMLMLLSQSRYDLFGQSATTFGAAHNDQPSTPPLRLTRINELTSMVRIGKEFGEPLPHTFWHNETERILAAAMSPNGKFIATLGSSVPGLHKAHEIRLWDANTGDLLAVTATGSGGGSAAGRSATVTFVTSECLLFQVEPFGR